MIWWSFERAKRKIEPRFCLSNSICNKACVSYFSSRSCCVFFFSYNFVSNLIQAKSKKFLLSNNFIFANIQLYCIIRYDRIVWFIKKKSTIFTLKSRFATWKIDNMYWIFFLCLINHFFNVCISFWLLRIKFQYVCFSWIFSFFFYKS